MRLTLRLLQLRLIYSRLMHMQNSGEGKDEWDARKELKRITTHAKHRRPRHVADGWLASWLALAQNRTRITLIQCCVQLSATDIFSYCWLELLLRCGSWSFAFLFAIFAWPVWCGGGRQRSWMLVIECKSTCLVMIISIIIGAVA